MRLKQLKINGFKSFADTTVIDFPGAVSGIVGPNGCGKSNVIDAIRWVLGEARVSELRGSSSMSELIFSGSSNRPRSSRASVEMVLDNSDGTVSGAWGRYTELSVKRIVTRDGTNAYLINNQQVRRRDVQDIFLGTGLGPRSYAIISQGMISNFIKAKPEELRVYLEEAAGISKYKERRKETESALATTRDNLEKVRYLQETKRQEIERLTGEAEVAARWRKLEDERLQAELLWYFVQESDAQASIDKLNARIAQKEEEMLKARGRSQSLTVEIENLRQAAVAAREAADAARKEAWDANARVLEIEGNIRHIVERKDALKREIAGSRDTMDRRASEKEEALQRVAALKAQVQEAQEQAQAFEEEAAGLEEEVENRNDEYERCRDIYDRVRREETEAQKEIGILEVRMQALGREYDDVVERIESLKSEMKPSSAPDEEHFEELSAQLEEKAQSLEEEQALSEELLEAYAQAKEDYERVCAHKQTLTEAYGRTAARLQTLESVQAEAEDKGKLPQWLKTMGLDHLPRVYELISMNDKWARAVEAVLSVKASGLTMTQLSRAAGFGMAPPPARLVMYGQCDAPKISVQEAPADLVPLKNFVRSEEKLVEDALKVWFAGVYVADNLNEAVANRVKLSEGERFVVAEGHIVDRASISFWAEENTAAGTLSRSVEIKRLTEEQRSQRQELDKAQEAVIAAKAHLVDAEVQSKAKDAFCRALADQKHALEVEYSALKSAVEAYRTRSIKVARDLKTLTDRSQELDARKAECEEQFEDCDRKLSQAQQKTADARMRLEEAEQAEADAQEGVRSARNNAKMAQLQVENARERILDAQRRSQSAQEEMEIISARLEECMAELENLDESAQREGLTEMLSERDEKNAKSQAAEDDSRRAEDAVETARADQKKIDEAQAPMLQEIGELKVRRENWAAQSQAFTQRLDESAADRTELREIVIREGLKSAGLKTKVNSLAQQIAALGAVNHAALENLEASRRAMEETERQVSDLEEAIANLEATIRKIDAETRELLRNTFDRVNANFTEMFSGLFGGGSAELKMTGDEILESGVEVIAQPPGKRNASVKLLSGGEQAMTATALVFAIFRLNPAPFCLLDEVDAPLDEANQDRLARRIIEMSANTQFMMITHHRVTMEHIGRLVGVTMKEPGVSRVVAVDIAAAVDLARS